MDVSNGQPPCLRCAERAIGCHAQRADGSFLCARYGAWCLHQQAIKAQAEKMRREAADVKCAHAEGARVNRNRKKRRTGA